MWPVRILELLKQITGNSGILFGELDITSSP